MRNSSIVNGMGTAGPRKGQVGLSAERADVGAFIFAELDQVGVIAVMEDGVPPLAAEYAAWRKGVPLAAMRKGTQTVARTGSSPINVFNTS